MSVTHFLLPVWEGFALAFSTRLLVLRTTVR